MTIGEGSPSPHGGYEDAVPCLLEEKESSRLEWLPNQYRMSTYSRYASTHAPNDPGDTLYIADPKRG